MSATERDRMTADERAVLVRMIATILLSNVIADMDAEDAEQQQGYALETGDGQTVV
jgi:hypothetical protein